MFNRAARRSVPVLTGAALLAGAVLTIGIGEALHATSSDAFCSNCHAQNATAEWKQSSHYMNRSGFIAHCSDCHLPAEFVPMVQRKLRAVNEIRGQFTGVIDTQQKYDAHRQSMAEIEWARLRANDARECRNCHHADSMAGQARAGEMHRNALTGGQVCTDCHKGVGHRARRAS